MHVRDAQRDGKNPPSHHAQLGALLNMVHLDPGALSDTEDSNELEVVDPDPSPAPSSSACKREMTIEEARCIMDRHNEHANAKAKISRTLIAVSSDEGAAPLPTPIMSAEEVNFMLFGKADISDHEDEQDLNKSSASSGDIIPKAPEATDTKTEPDISAAFPVDSKAEDDQIIPFHLFCARDQDLPVVPSVGDATDLPAIHSDGATGFEGLCGGLPDTEVVLPSEVNKRHIEIRKQKEAELKAKADAKQLDKECKLAQKAANEQVKEIELQLEIERKQEAVNQNSNPNDEKRLTARLLQAQKKTRGCHKKIELRSGQGPESYEERRQKQKGNGKRRVVARRRNQSEHERLVRLRVQLIEA